MVIINNRKMIRFDFGQTLSRKRDKAGAGGAVRAGRRHVYRSHQVRRQGLQVQVSTCPCKRRARISQTEQASIAVNATVS